MAGLPEARLLEALIVVSGARWSSTGNVYRGRCAGDGRGGAGGRPVVTLERDPDNAAVARRHIAASPLAERIELIEGDARETLPGSRGRLTSCGSTPGRPTIRCTLTGGAQARAARDHRRRQLFRDGAALPPAADDEATRGVLDFARQVQEHERLHNVLLTVGDGLLLAWPAPG